MRFIATSAFLVCLFTAQANAQSCWQDKVRNSGGQVLALSSGQIFRIYPGAGRITAGWLPLDKLTVCPIGGNAVQITNTSRKNQQIKALRAN